MKPLKLTGAEKYRAQQFLKARATTGGNAALAELEKLPFLGREKVIHWLTYWHNMRFI